MVFLHGRTSLLLICTVSSHINRHISQNSRGTNLSTNCPSKVYMTYKHIVGLTCAIILHII